MKILAGRVRNFGETIFANSPTFELLVDEFPPLDQLRYEKIHHSYYAHLDGYVRFFSWNGEPGEGFGGRHFPITLVDGTEVTLKGPWSSRAGWMNRIFRPRCLDVSFTSDPKVYERGYTFYAGAVSLDAMIEGLPLIETPKNITPERWFSWALVEVLDGHDTRYDPVLVKNKMLDLLTPVVPIKHLDEPSSGLEDLSSDQLKVVMA